MSSGRVEKSPHEQEIKFFAKVRGALLPFILQSRAMQMVTCGLSAAWNRHMLNSGTHITASYTSAMHLGWYRENIWQLCASPSKRLAPRKKQLYNPALEVGSLVHYLVRLCHWRWYMRTSLWTSDPAPAGKPVLQKPLPVLPLHPGQSAGQRRPLLQQGEGNDRQVTCTVRLTPDTGNLQ